MIALQAAFGIALGLYGSYRTPQATSRQSVLRMRILLRYELRLYRLSAYHEEVYTILLLLLLYNSTVL